MTEPLSPPVQELAQGMLAMYLAEIERCDKAPQDYDRRNFFTYQAMAWAAQCGYRVGFVLDKAEPDWPVAYIDLPTGQVSWHLPAYPDAWDGHDTPEKYRRIAEFINNYDLGRERD